MINKTKGNEGKEVNKYNLFGDMGKTFSDWEKRVLETLKYKPNLEKLVQIYCLNGDEKKLILENPEYLDGDNFHLQIGKMQKNGGTIYNEITLGLGIEYMIKHTKKGKKSIIQIWSDVGECLQPGAEKGVLTAKEEKEYLENFIRKNFGKKGEAAIEVVIGPEHMEDFIMRNLRNRLDVLNAKIKKGDFSEYDESEYKRIGNAIQNMKDNPNELFKTISKGKEGIIPKEEPTLENPITSPLQIIQYLAFHANNDKDLMDLFYRTKPAKYIGQDIQNKVNPGDSDADFYGIVEIGLRLYEVLNGISIQGGLGRQRVYDKIISLIINGKDVIKGKKEFDCDYNLSFYEKGYKDNTKYPALKKLHDFCEKNYPDTKFNPLYINLYGGDNGSINEVKEKMNEKSKLISKLKTRGYGALIAATLSGATGYITNNIIKNKEEQKQERYEQERIEMHRHYYNEIREGRGGGGLEGWRESEYIEEQSNILMAEYNISSLNQETWYGEICMIDNDIIEMYRKAFSIRSWETRKNIHAMSKLNIEDLTEQEYRDLFGHLDAEEFARAYWGQIINEYHLPYQKPYEHFNQYKDIIENTLNYGDIDISKYKTKEIPTESELSYFIKYNPSQEDTQSRGFYSLKCIEVDLGNGKKIKMFVAAKKAYYRMGSNEVLDYTGHEAYQCMFDLTTNYPYVIN